jgi:hypothetical protein
VTGVCGFMRHVIFSITGFHSEVIHALLFRTELGALNQFVTPTAESYMAGCQTAPSGAFGGSKKLLPKCFPVVPSKGFRISGRGFGINPQKRALPVALKSIRDLENDGPLVLTRRCKHWPSWFEHVVLKVKPAIFEEPYNGQTKSLH